MQGLWGGAVVKINAIKCPFCHDAIYSRTGHDFHSCSCGKSSIDGGHYANYKLDDTSELFYERVLFTDNAIPVNVQFELDVTAKQLYDDWNFGVNKYGLMQ